ncbi:MAG: hypothetical protein AAF609_14990 [Cyanobacteria bacterium P01_C01_bin.120]
MALVLQTFKLTGAVPIILHNGRTANPLDQWSKAMKIISSKRNKTDADHEQLAKLEWYASLYQDKQGRIILPGMLIESALQNGAKKHKLGTTAKAALFVDQHALLEFDGMELSADELWERGENTLTVACRVQTSKVMRTRFIAEEWAAVVTVTYEDALLNLAQVVDIVNATGSQVGVGTWRPKHGRFFGEIEQMSKAA